MAQAQQIWTVQGTNVNPYQQQYYRQQVPPSQQYQHNFRQPQPQRYTPQQREFTVQSSRASRSPAAAVVPQQAQQGRPNFYRSDAQRVAPQPYKSYTREQPASYVHKSIPGYAGYVPGRQFLRGSGTFGAETNTISVYGRPTQPLQPTEQPRRYDNGAQKQDVNVPGYAGHVHGQRFTCGNYRVNNFEEYHKGEVRLGSQFNYSQLDM